MSSAAVRIVLVVLALFGIAGGGFYWSTKRQNPAPAPQANAPAGQAPAGQAPAGQAPVSGQPSAGQAGGAQPAPSQAAPSQSAQGQPASGQPAPGQTAQGATAPGNVAVPMPPDVPAAAATPLDAGAARPAAQAVPAPSSDPAFDVVRVEPNGDSVIAGRGVPGAAVELLRNGVVHDRATADASGLFAMTPPPLPPGEHSLALRFVAPDGSVTQPAQSVTVVVAADRATPPVVALAAPGAPTVVVSTPDAGRAAPAAPAAGATGQAAPRAAAIRTVESEEGGKLFVSGVATPGASVRLYLNDSYLASAVADAQGAVSFAIQGGIRPGDYRVRLDQLAGPGGQVANRAEVTYAVPALPQRSALAPGQQGQAPAATPATGAPGAPAPGAAAPGAAAPAPGSPAGGAAPIQAAPAAGAPVAAAPGSPPAGAPAAAPPAAGRPVASTPGTVVVPEVKTTIVSRGDSLWRISQRVYGQGIRYTVIYGANDTQIRDPDLIYPGQVFVLPSEREPAAQRPPG